MRAARVRRRSLFGDGPNGSGACLPPVWFGATRSWDLHRVKQRLTIGQTRLLHDLETSLS
jgi:hypothetical protein